MDEKRGGFCVMCEKPYPPGKGSPKNRYMCMDCYEQLQTVALPPSQKDGQPICPRCMEPVGGSDRICAGCGGLLAPK
jgi:hypothetical protein